MASTAAKGTIQTNHFPNNQYRLVVPAFPLITTILEIDGLDIETETVDMPDRTVVSGGHRKTLDFTVKVPTHHTEEMTSWQAWLQMGAFPVVPGYKQPVTLVQTGLHGDKVKVYEIIGMFPYKKGLAGMSMKDEGNLSETTINCKADDFLPIAG